MTMTIDAGRLVRALTLTVRPLDDGDGYEVSGGHSPHVVRSTEDGMACDCPDSLYHAGECKHLLAVTLARRLDRRMLEALAVAIGGAA